MNRSVRIRKSYRFWMTILFFSTAFYAHTQAFESVKVEQVENLLQKDNDTLYVLNFWATWCDPCIKEIPYFEEVSEELSDEKVKIIFICLDFESDIESRVIPFLEKRKLKNEVWHLNESKPNDYIPKIEDGWSGAIPFTLFYRGSDNYRFWKEGEFTKAELRMRIKTKL